MIYLWILFYLLFGGNFDAESELQKSEDLLKQLEEVVNEKAEKMKIEKEGEVNEIRINVTEIGTAWSHTLGEEPVER